MNRPRVLGRVSAAEFVGRTVEFNVMMRLAEESRVEGKDARGLLLLAAPGHGASELLRQVYDELFSVQNQIIPFYFAFNKMDRTAGAAARRFLQTFLQQTVAYRQADPKLLDTAPDVREIAELAAPTDGYWINRLAVALETEVRAGDEAAFIRQAFSVPLRASASGAVSLVLLDDFDQADDLLGGVSLVSEISQIYARSTVPFVIGGRRRFLLGATQGAANGLDNTTLLKLPALSTQDAGQVAAVLARRSSVALVEQTRDLLVQQFQNAPALIQCVMLAARDRAVPLDSFHHCEQIYVEELLGGRLNRRLSGVLERVATTSAAEREILEALYDTLYAENNRLPIEDWRARISLDATEVDRLLRELHTGEFVRTNGGVVEVPPDSIVIRDYINARHQLEVTGEPRALVVATTLAVALKRAPELMARFYRRTAAIGLRELLARFNLQTIPRMLFDSYKFRELYRGVGAAEVTTGLNRQVEKIVLPQIVYTSSCAAVYPAIAALADEERCAVGLGFETGDYTDENQTTWIAVEVESKLEAGPGIVEFWLDRLEALALFCNFKRVQYWLVSSEGFAPEAAELMTARGAFGSSRQMVELLAAQLSATEVLNHHSGDVANDFEMVVPMGDDTEIISAQTVEEIARRHHFSPQAVNQIKTALVEACINASEHSHSPDRKIHQRFAMENDKLIITVTNRGVQMPMEVKGSGLTDDSHDSETLDGRRGWGLRIIRSLMDEVDFERTDDGTRLRMAKRLQH